MLAYSMHPTLQGTYLAAAVFYSTLWNRSPADQVNDAGTDPAVARRLREIAWEAVQAYRNRQARCRFRESRP